MRKSPVRIKISHEGTFGRYGYKTTNTAISRRRSLARVARAKGAGMTVRRLNALVVLNKNRSPALSRKFKSDMKWVQAKFNTNKKSKRKSRVKNTRKSPRKSTRKSRRR